MNKWRTFDVLAMPILLMSVIFWPTVCVTCAKFPVTLFRSFCEHRPCFSNRTISSDFPWLLDCDASRSRCSLRSRSRWSIWASFYFWWIYSVAFTVRVVYRYIQSDMDGRKVSVFENERVQYIEIGEMWHALRVTCAATSKHTDRFHFVRAFVLDQEQCHDVATTIYLQKWITIVRRQNGNLIREQCHIRLFRTQTREAAQTSLRINEMKRG